MLSFAFFDFPTAYFILGMWLFFLIPLLALASAICLIIGIFKHVQTRIKRTASSDIANVSLAPRFYIWSVGLLILAVALTPICINAMSPLAALYI